MARVLSMLAEDDDDEEFPGEHAGSSAAGRMVVPPIAAIPFVTKSKSLTYELYWMLESSLVENCSVVIDDEDDRMSVGTPPHSAPLNMCCFEGDDDAAPSSLTGTRTSPTRMLLLVIVAFVTLLVFWLLGVLFLWMVGAPPELRSKGAQNSFSKFFRRKRGNFCTCVSWVEKALLSTPIFSLSVVRKR